MCYNVFSVDYSAKDAQISESDFGKPQNWETFRYLSDFEFSGVIYD